MLGESAHTHGGASRSGGHGVSVTGGRTRDQASDAPWSFPRRLQRGWSMSVQAIGVDVFGLSGPFLESQDEWTVESRT